MSADDKQDVESRRERRARAGGAVQLTVLGESRKPIEGHVQDRSRRGMRIQVGEALASGSAVKLEWDDLLMLAEVVYCRQEGGHYTAGLEISEALRNTRQLAQLAGELLAGKR